MRKEVFRLSRVSGQAVTDDQLLSDLRRVAGELGKATVGQKEYRRLGTYDDSTARSHFGSWNKALKAAGLEVANEVNLGDALLFENLLCLWTHYGRQPRRSELSQPPSTISQSAYRRRFGTWSAALTAFVEHANAQSEDGVDVPVSTVRSNRSTPRDPSLRLRFRVLQRDRFSCRACGASPATNPQVRLHVDHVLAWSLGGETTLDNLQTLCITCNLGKGALPG
jgi:HNH endonuclease